MLGQFARRVPRFGHASPKVAQMWQGGRAFTEPCRPRSLGLDSIPKTPRPVRRSRAEATGARARGPTSTPTSLRTLEEVSSRFTVVSRRERGGSAEPRAETRSPTVTSTSGEPRFGEVRREVREPITSPGLGLALVWDCSMRADFHGEPGSQTGCANGRGQGWDRMPPPASVENGNTRRISVLRPLRESPHGSTMGARTL